MKKYLSFFLAVFFFTSTAEGFDYKGLQPLAPYGVFSTFSADSLKKGTSGVAFWFERSSDPNFSRITGQFATGFSDNLEFLLTVPYVIDWQSENGFEDIHLAVKHRLINEGTYNPSLAYILGASVNTGAHEFSTEGSVGAGLIVTKRVGPFKGHLNLLYSKPLTNRLEDEVAFAAGLDFAAAHNFRLLAELYTTKGYSGKVDRLEATFGCRIFTEKDLITTLGVGTDFKNRNPEFRLLLSLTYLFPKEKREIKRIYETEE